MPPVRARADVLIARSTPVAPEPRVERAARCLSGLGIRIEIVAWDREGRFPKRQELNEGVWVERFRAPGRYGGGLANLPGLFIFNLKILRQLIRVRPLVYHAVDLDTALPGLLAKGVLGVRLVYDIADWFAMSRPRNRFLRRFTPILRLFHRIEQQVAAYADCVCLPHESRKALLPAGLPAEVVIVHNSPEDVAQAHASHPAEASEPYFAYVGGLYEDRGIRYLQAAAELARIKIAIAGFGPLEEECRRMAAESEFVVFLGRVEYAEAIAVQAGSRGVLLLYDPSLSMNQLGAPYKLYEAMMLSKPIIAARDTWPGDLAQQENIGIAINYGSPDEVAAAMQYLATHEQEAREMGKRARVLYEKRYAWDKQCEKLREAYRILLSR